MRRRGELSIEIIIIAAIALLVLVILTVLILRGGVGLGEGTSCEAQAPGQSYCTDDECEEGYYRSGHTCSEETFCCLPLVRE